MGLDVLALDCIVAHAFRLEAAFGTGESVIALAHRLLLFGEGMAKHWRASVVRELKCCKVVTPGMAARSRWIAGPAAHCVASERIWVVAQIRAASHVRVSWSTGGLHPSREETHRAHAEGSCVHTYRCILPGGVQLRGPRAAKMRRPPSVPYNATCYATDVTCVVDGNRHLCLTDGSGYVPMDLGSGPLFELVGVSAPVRNSMALANALAASPWGAERRAAPTVHMATCAGGDRCVVTANGGAWLLRHRAQEWEATIMLAPASISLVKGVAVGRTRVVVVARHHTLKFQLDGETGDVLDALEVDTSERGVTVGVLAGDHVLVATPTHLAFEASPSCPAVRVRTPGLTERLARLPLIAAATCGRCVLVASAGHVATYVGVDPYGVTAFASAATYGCPAGRIQAVAVGRGIWVALVEAEPAKWRVFVNRVSDGHNVVQVSVKGRPTAVHITAAALLLVAHDGDGLRVCVVPWRDWAAESVAVARGPVHAARFPTA